MMMDSRIMRDIGVVGMLVGLLAWSGTAQAVKPNPPGKQAGQFVVLGTGDVLDVRTSLRWQQTPGAPGNTVSNCDSGNACTWQEAVDYCAALGSGSRLAEVKELISLLDYSQFNPALPPGNPFSKESAVYWSATATADTPTFRWWVFFGTGAVGNSNQGVGANPAWCVR